MKAILLIFFTTGIYFSSFAQTDLLLLPKDSIVSKMRYVYKNWEFNKQSEEFTNGVSYDLYEYSSKAKDMGDLTFLFDKNGLCFRIMYLTSQLNSDKLITLADQNYIRSGKDTWVDKKTGQTLQVVFKRNEAASTVSLEFMDLIYKPAL